jgi:hypothetical protein
MKKTLYVDLSVFAPVSENEMEEVNGGLSGCAQATNPSSLGGYPGGGGSSGSGSSSGGGGK